MTNSDSSISTSTKVSADKPNGWKSTELGNIPHHWDLIPARKFCTKVADGTHDTPKPKEKGKYLVTSKHIKNGKVDLSSAYMISNEDFFEINKRSKVDQWDVLLSMIGTVGEICLIDEIPDFAIKNVGLFKCDEEYKAKWLYYFLRSKTGQHEIQRKMTGTTQSYITLGSLRNFPIIIPEKKEELKNIVTVLSSLDNKIELLREENKTLETLAQTIFKEWFVNFNFPGSTNKMIDSELGEIPEAWRIGKLTEVTKICGGTTPSTKNSEYWNGEIHWTSPKDLSNLDEIFLSKTEKKVTKKGLTQVSSGLLPKETLLLSSRAPIGYLAICNIEVAINQGYIAILPNQYFSNYFMFIWLKLKMQKIINAANGSTFLEISKTSFKNIECIIPDRTILRKFDNAILPIFKKNLLNTKQIHALSKLRNTLLPKLIRGEIRVKNIN